MDENGSVVGDQFYVRVAVGNGETDESEAFQSFEDFVASKGGTVYNMNETFTLGGFDLRVYDVHRNNAVCAPGVITVNDGVWAIARIMLTSHVPHTVRFVADNVYIGMMDNEFNTYEGSHEPWSVARKAVIAAGRHFDNRVGFSYSDVQPDYVDYPILAVEGVPVETDILYLVLMDQDTEEFAFVRLQPLVSKSEMRYEGEFIDALPRE